MLPSSTPGPRNDDRYYHSSRALLSETDSPTLHYLRNKRNREQRAHPDSRTNDKRPTRTALSIMPHADYYRTSPSPTHSAHSSGAGIASADMLAFSSASSDGSVTYTALDVPSPVPTPLTATGRQTHSLDHGNLNRRSIHATSSLLPAAAYTIRPPTSFTLPPRQSTKQLPNKRRRTGRSMPISQLAAIFAAAACIIVGATWAGQAIIRTFHSHNSALSANWNDHQHPELVDIPSYHHQSKQKPSSKVRPKYNKHRPPVFEPLLADPQRDTVAIYRILGNDLPPRHQAGQTLRNLRFLLEHEKEFPETLSPNGLRIEKYWVLNRLPSERISDPILALLEEFGIAQDKILSIPFDWDAYKEIGLRWDGDVAHGLAEGGNDGMAAIWGIGTSNAATKSFQQLTEYVDSPNISDKERLERRQRYEVLSRLKPLDYTFCDKNIYAINNNGGRNFALSHGRSLPHVRWVLPLDGNSFFTPSALQSILTSLSISGERNNHKQYAVIPMSRLLDNSLIHANNTFLSYDEEPSDYAPTAPDEPQIGFRYDSTATYQLEMRYGRRSKLELLWRLGAIPYSRKMDENVLPWESADRLFITREAHSSIKLPKSEEEPFIRTGWVHRLFSGERSQEEHNPQANQLRRLNRMRGIVRFLENLDEQIVRGHEGCHPGDEEEAQSRSCGYHKDKFWHWDSHALAQLRHSYKAGRPAALLSADKIRSVAKFKLQHITTQLRNHSQEYWQNSDPHTISNDAAVLALAGYILSEASYSHAAARLISARFLALSPLVKRAGHSALDIAEPAGYSFPLSSTQDAPLWSRLHSSSKFFAHSQGPPPFSVTDFDPSVLLDTLRLLSSSYSPWLSSSNVLPAAQIRSLFSSHLSALLFDENLIAQVSKSPDNASVGASYDIKVATLAAYLDDAIILSRVVQRSHLRTFSLANERGSLAGRIQKGLRNIGYPVQDKLEVDVDQITEAEKQLMIKL